LVLERGFALGKEHLATLSANLSLQRFPSHRNALYFADIAIHDILLRIRSFHFRLKLGATPIGSETPGINRLPLFSIIRVQNDPKSPLAKIANLHALAIRV
jgi:hypothetical protein